ncbi:MAG: 50S ribosomal protein L29 [Patescibacteria group bacterium]
MELTDLRQRTPQELERLEQELRAKLHDAEFAVAMHQSKKVRDLRDLKRDLARVLTILRQTTPTV